MEYKTYNDYANWKGWLTEKKFFTISNEEFSHFDNQFKKINVPIKNKNVLDFGFGPGNLLKYFKLNNCNIAGVEIQQSLIDSAKNIGIEVYQSIDEISDNNKFDIITAIDVLEHMNLTQIQDFIFKAEKLLSKDGMFIFRYPNGESPASLPAQNGDYTHINSIGITKLNQIIEPFNLYISYYNGEFVRSPFFPFNYIRTFSRYLFSKLTGLGNNYFFFCNVIAVVKKKNISI